MMGILDDDDTPQYGSGHNSGGVAADQLRLLLERVERLSEEKDGIMDDIRDVFLEAKSVGFDVKIMRQVLKIRKMDKNDRAEQQAILDTYLSALGLD